MVTMSAFGDNATVSASGDMRLKDSSDFGNIIRAERMKRGFSQQQLADALGVSRQWISEIENGKPRAELQLVLSTFNFLQIQLHTQPPGPAAPSPCDNMPNIDINAIVDGAGRS
ncbi:MAG: HTH-type transcriptional regulator/antitoxin HipB [Myxococcota bacterium]|jgi:HTH-type transcriptional regulator/antitoxin HipB